MTPLELAADVLSRNLDFVNFTLADFTEQDMLVRPVPGANHAAWQIGHLITAESGMVNAVTPGAGAELPAGFAEKFSKETAKSDDPKAFPSKAELLAALAKTRAASVAWAKKLTPADLDKAAPERMQQFVPTVGHLLLMLPVHTTMHIGQFQVIRRKLGRPVMF